MKRRGFLSLLAALPLSLFGLDEHSRYVAMAKRMARVWFRATNMEFRYAGPPNLMPPHLKVFKTEVDNLINEQWKTQQNVKTLRRL